MENRKTGKFEYTYRAPTEEERREIENIRRFYRSSDEQGEKYLRLKKLNARVKNSAAACALALGVAGCLIFGLGMSLILARDLLIAGIAVSAAGAIPMLLANPVYSLVLRKNKRKYGEEILRLSEELLRQDK